MKIVRGRERSLMLLSMTPAHAWNPATLKGHMDAEAALYPPNLFWRINKIRPGLARVLNLLATILVLAITFWFAPELVAGGDPSFGIAMAFLFAISFFHLVWGRTRSPAEWKEYEVDEALYRNSLGLGEYLPLFAYRMTQDIKRLIPKARFKIWSLEQDNVKLDPVLVCVIDGEEFPVLVWDGNNNIVRPN